MAQHHVLGLSGGKDSAALAIFMRERHPEIDLEYFFTDTGKELPEVYEFLGKLEGFLGRRIHALNPQRTFDFWLREYNSFLPSARTRWCTRQLKLLPLRQWITPWLDAGDEVISYVAIRSDEDHREGYSPTNDKMFVKMPFRDHSIDKQGVYDILESSGIGLPAYYKWRSRSGCTFCFFQQKIEWVRLKQVHPEKFEEAKAYEKTALSHGSPFTWSQGESLVELEQPERVAQIISDYDARRKRIASMKRSNPLRVLHQTTTPEEIDDLYDIDEGGGACHICHK
jgi:3'-phosphoadenosine 5'-phosphosulfate sulfotransferase (PAPS reductase)/FAD synthetase